MIIREIHAVTPRFPRGKEPQDNVLRLSQDHTSSALAARGKRQFRREEDSHPVIRPREINTLHGRNE
jgi:hypothetical protein